MLINFIDRVYAIFGLTYDIELSTRPEEKYIGDINYISATEDEITRQILFGNALFEAGGMEEF